VTIISRIPFAAMIFGAVALAGWRVHAETNRVKFPENLDQLVHYTTVERGNVTEHIMTTREAVEAVRNGQPVPNGTHFVLVDHRDGKLYRYFAMQKGDGWDADYDERRRTGNWQFQWFWPDKTVNLNENTVRCQSCHRSQATSYDVKIPMLPKPISLVLSSFLALASMEAKGDEVKPPVPGAGEVARASEHAHLILPWDNRAYDENMRLSDLGSLLPYHTHVRPEIVVGALNHMIDDAANGKAIFHDFYTQTQKRNQPAKNNTGLFFFRGKPGAPFAVISPGGGFSYVGSIHEGFPYAVEISNKGYNAFVLRYRAGQGGTVATEDLAAALSYIFRNAAMLGVSIDNYSVWGSSAGARMAAAIASRGTASHGGDDLPKPSAVVMAYTAHSDTSPDEPPTFAVVGELDAIAPPSAMERRVAALRKAGTEVEYHRYKDLGHGFGLGTGTSADEWITDAVRFWEKFIRSRN
jgi:acetyl esterase/lipase